MMEEQEVRSKQRQFPGLGFGIFIVVASLFTLGEQLGFIPSDLKWGLPTIGIIFGGMMVVRALTGKA